MIRMLSNSFRNSVKFSQKSRFLIQRRVFCFSSTSTTDNKAKQLIEQLTKNPTAVSLPVFLSKMYILPEKQKQIVLKYMLMGIYQNKICYTEGKNKLQDFLRLFPDINLQYNMWQINQLQKAQKQKKNSQEIKLLDKQINDKYFHIYHNILPSIKNQFKKVRSQALFNKNFGRHLMQLINQKSFTKAEIELNADKGKKFLEKAIQCFRSIVIHELKKFQSEDFKEQKKKNNQIHGIRQNALKENVRRLVQAIAQCSYSIFTENTRLKLLNVREETHQSLNKLIQMYAIFKDSIKMYSVIPNIKSSSIYYHRISKINIELIDKIQKIQAKQKQNNLDQIFSKVNIIKQLEQFQKQCLQNISEGGSPEIVKQICIALMTVKYHLQLRKKCANLALQKLTMKQIEQIRSSLQDEIFKIILLVKQQYKNSSKKLLVEVLNYLLPIR